MSKFKIDDFTHTIELYRKILSNDPMRHISKPALQLIGHFKAAIEHANFTKPTDTVAAIYHLDRIYVRVSNFYRQEFTKDNLIKFQQRFMRIASVSYNRITGISCCTCYDVDI